MSTRKQKLGKKGEKLIVQQCSCPRCKHEKTLKQLPRNFKCADIICEFCGYLAQVKTKRTNDTERLPNSILGGAWVVQKERMDAGIYFPLFIVLINDKKEHSIHYLPADLQPKEMFIPRKPLSENAKRAGWQGFMYDLTKPRKGAIVRIR